MDKKYCIFDMDGTLVDSMSYWRSLEFEFLSSHGVDAEVIPVYVERLKPMTLVDAAKVFIAELGFTGTPQSIADEMNAVMENHYRYHVGLKSGIADYLEALKKRGTTLCTASATNAPLVRICLERLGILGYFDFSVSCVDVGASKDRPDIYFECARRLGSQPRETAVFEDSLSALTTAKGAGFYGVGVFDNASSNKWQHLQALADETVVDWSEAARVLNA